MGDSSSIPGEIPGRAGDDDAKVIKKHEFQLQAAGTRFDLV